MHAADQSLQAPLTQLRVCIPHSPHGWFDGPVHVFATGAIVEGDVGTTAGVMIDAHAPHSGVASVFDAQAVVMTTLPPCAAVLEQTPGGSEIVAPLSVQSDPSLKTSQHPVVPHTPAPPSGNCSATLIDPALAPEGTLTEQLAPSSEAAVAEAKQSCTSKQPAWPASAPPASEAAPSTSAPP
jgi:hypothetical protein